MYGDYKLLTGSFSTWDSTSDSYDHKKASKTISNTKQLVKCMLNMDISEALFNTAWKQGLKERSVNPSKNITIDDSSKTLLHDAYETYRIIDLIISSIVNNPKSKYYLYG